MPDLNESDLPLLLAPAPIYILVYSGDATKRQVSEAIQIQHAQGAVMNRHDEWRQVKLPRIQLSLS